MIGANPPPLIKFALFTLLGVCAFGIGYVYQGDFLTPENVEQSFQNSTEQKAEVFSATNWHRIWCGIRLVFNFPCEEDVISEYAIVTETKEENLPTSTNPVDPQASTTKQTAPVSTDRSESSVTNVYPTTYETIREVIIRDGVVDTSRFVT